MKGNRIQMAKEGNINTEELQRSDGAEDPNGTDFPDNLLRSAVSSLRKMVVNLEVHLKTPDDINALAFLMGFKNFRSIEKETKESEYPLFVVMEKAEEAGKVQDDNVDLLIDALEALTLRHEHCQKALDVVQKYKNENCGEAGKEPNTLAKRDTEIIQGGKMENIAGEKGKIDFQNVKGDHIHSVGKFLEWCDESGLQKPAEATREDFLAYFNKKAFKSQQTRYKHLNDISPYLTRITDNDKKIICEQLKKGKDSG